MDGLEKMGLWTASLGCAVGICCTRTRNCGFLSSPFLSSFSFPDSHSPLSSCAVRLLWTRIPFASAFKVLALLVCIYCILYMHIHMYVGMGGSQDWPWESYLVILHVPVLTSQLGHSWVSCLCLQCTGPQHLPGICVGAGDLNSVWQIAHIQSLSLLPFCF